MRLPEVAARLRELADQYGDGELRFLADEIGRRTPERRAPVTSRKMTPALAQEIFSYWVADPTISQAAVARHFNVNPGRVSEVIRGFRK